MKEKFIIKDLWYGLLHVMVALSAILFVCGATGINLPLSFLTIGIGTLVFHLFTKNKLAVLMGVSGSFIGGMVLVASQYGPSYVAGGVVIAGLIYILAGILIGKKPEIYNKFPKYILNSAVFLIALNLLPIGANMASSNITIAIATVGFGFLVFCSKKFSQWTFPLSLLFGTVLSVITQGIPTITTGLGKIVFTMPEFNIASFALIGIVALAVVFEGLGDSKNCANAQEIELDGKDFSNILLGNGTASTISGLMGGLPLTTYSENIGFIYLTGYKRPMAQIVASIIFIIMAFIPGISAFLTIIPPYVYGAMLLFLFSLIGANSLINMDLKDDKQIKVMISMLTTFFICPASVFSPIAAAILVGFIIHIILNRKEKA